MPGRLQQLEIFLQQSRGQPPTHQYDLHSNLVTKLMKLAFAGSISHTAAQEIALAAILDGAKHPELAELASAGSFGTYTGNIKRDVMTKWAGNVQIAEPDIIKVPAMNAKTNEAYMQEVAFFLPHKLLASLSKYEYFDAIFKTSCISAFWGAIADDDPRLVALFAEMGWTRADLTNAIPLFLHGDGVEYTENDSLEVCDFGPLLGYGDSMGCTFLCFAFPNSCCIPSSEKNRGTMGALCAKVASSFKSCMVGLHPMDDCGKAWPIGSSEALMAGQPLTQKGYKFVVWALTGDHEHYANFLKLPHWSKHQFCWCCDADRTKPTKKGFDFRDGKMNLKLRKVEEELEKRLSWHSFFEIPGVTSFSVFHDPLHVLFTKGVLSHLYGSFIHTLCYSGKGHQAVPPSQRLAIIVQRMQELYTEMGIESRIGGLQLSMICDPSKPHKDYPTFRAKGSETKHLLPVLIQISQETLDRSEPMTEHRHKAFTAIYDFCKLMETSPDVPGDALGAMAVHSVKTFLCEYKWLSDWAVAQERMLYHMVPKFHLLWHLALDFKHLNPKLVWTFKTEDYVGQISRLAHSCCFSVARARVSVPMCKQYRCLMHLQLDRCQLGDEF